MSYPVRTEKGEQVMIVEKMVAAGGASQNSTVLIADDGRKFRPTRNGLYVVEIDEATTEEAPAPDRDVKTEPVDQPSGVEAPAEFEPSEEDV